MTRSWTMPRSWNRRPRVRPAALRAAANARWQAWAKRQALAGRTTRGTVPKRKFMGRNIARRLIYTDIDSLAAALGKTFGLLTPEAQRRVLALERHLAMVRHKLL